jgi:hypothetical protein
MFAVKRCGGGPGSFFSFFYPGKPSAARSMHLDPRASRKSQRPTVRLNRRPVESPDRGRRTGRRGFHRVWAGQIAGPRPPLRSEGISPRNGGERTISRFRNTRVSRFSGARRGKSDNARLGVTRCVGVCRPRAQQSLRGRVWPHAGCDHMSPCRAPGDRPHRGTAANPGVASLDRLTHGKARSASSFTDVVGRGIGRA